MGRTIRTCGVATLIAMLTAGTVSTAEARTQSPNRLTCSVLHPGAEQFCRVIEQRHAIRTLRGMQRIETQRVHLRMVLSAPAAGWKLARLKVVNTWERKRLAWLRSLPTPEPVGDVAAWTCIHKREGAWNATGYYEGGLQFDHGFSTTYGADMWRKYGTGPHAWSPRDQMVVAYRAWKVRGYSPWPNTARACGYL